MTNEKKIALIVPAYNEEQWIPAVLSVLEKIEFISEIVVVDDGSTDKTAEIAANYDSVKVLNLQKNSGKGAAIQAGLDYTSADVVVFIDADLLNLTEQHIISLIEPLMRDEKLMMTVGRLTGGKLSVDLAQRFVPILNGQRALKREFIKTLPDISKTGFGVEVFLSKHAKRIGANVQEVILDKLTQVMKEEKSGYVGGFLFRMKMYREGINTWRKFLINKKDIHI